VQMMPALLAGQPIDKMARCRKNPLPTTSFNSAGMDT